jgi:hypothetical protein
LNNKNIAFATDVSYRVTVRHASPRVLGRYEVEAHMPLSYDVTGSLTIIRYARGLKDALGTSATKDASNKGSGVGSFGIAGVNFSQLGLPDAKGQFDGEADAALNPQRFFQSKQFDIEIRQKIPNLSSNGRSLPRNAGEVLSTLVEAANQSLAPNVTNTAQDETSIVLLRDCRIEDFTFDLNKRGVAIQKLTFRARYADDDTFIARKSGVGQELT